MSGGNLKLLGWLAMASALLTVPLFLITLLTRGTAGLGAKLLTMSLDLLAAVLFIVLTVTLRRLLNRRFDFHAADRVIDLLIISNLILSGLGLFGTLVPAYEQETAQVLLIAAVTAGVLQIRFGWLLLALPAERAGLLRPYAYLALLTGCCLASILLLPLALLFGAISDVMLATIFLQAARTIDTTA